MARLLIIDDNTGTLETVSIVLKRAGFETATAQTGADGVALAKAEPFDAILIDLRLPDMSGLDVVRELDRHGVTARKVIVTAFPAEDTAFVAGAFGADGYVEGPLFDDDLMAVALQALDGPYPVLLGSRPAYAHPNLAIDPRVYDMMRANNSDLARASPRAISEDEEPTAGEPTALDGYARWVEAMVAVVTASHDVPGLEFWPSVLPTARSVGAIRHWCRAVSLPARGSLDLARSLRALVHGRRSGRDPRKVLSVATRETAERFWRKAGVDSEGHLPDALGEWLDRQQFIRDPDALKALYEALVHHLP